MSTVLPRWDVSDLWSSPRSAAYAAAREAAAADVTRLAALYDDLGVGTIAPHAPDPDEVAGFERVLAATNEVLGQLQRLSAYVTAYTAVDATDQVAQAEASSLQVDAARVAALRA